MNERHHRIRENFLKVLLASLTGVLQLVILGSALVLAVLFPSVSVWILGLALLTVLARAGLMLADDRFVQAVLAKSKKEQFNFLPELIQKVDQRLKEARFFSAVEQDLKEAKEALKKINHSWQALSTEKVARHTPIIRDLVDKLVNKLIELSRQEESAIRFLNQSNQRELRQDLESLEKQLQNARDQIARSEYAKALELKKNQQTALDRIKDRLERVNSYNARIIAELENTQTFLARLGLAPESVTDYGQTDYLSSSLQELADDLDKFEDEALEVGREIRRYVEEEKSEKKIEN
jgi:uncharacterized membrane protein YccC